MMEFRAVAARAGFLSRGVRRAGRCRAVAPALFLAAALAGPVAACDGVCAMPVAGPVQVIGSGPARVELVQTRRGWAVVFRNTIVKSLTREEWALDAGGMAVAGVILSGDEMIPDDLVVTPPPGWWCDPCSVTVPENDVGQVDLWPEVAA